MTDPHPHAARPARSLVALGLLGLVAIVCIALGRWQLERAQWRRDLQHTIAQGRASPPLTLAPDTPRQALRDWRMAQAQGAWRTDWTVLLDNRNQDGRPGYWVATPLALAGSSTAVLVLRGWLPRRFDGLPLEVPAPRDGGVIHGQLLSHVPRIYELPSLWGMAHEAQPDARATPVVTNLPLEDAARRTGLTLLPVVLQQLPDETAAPDGLVRQWEGPSVDADRNVGYAIQWFGFAAIALCAALGVAWRTWRVVK